MRVLTSSILLFLSLLVQTQVVTPTALGFMDDVVSEPSGLAVVYNTATGHFEYWVNNDYEYPDQIHSLKLSDVATLTRTIDVNQAYIDWEDMTSDEQNNIYLGDFGNWVSANELQIVKVPNPNSFTGAAPSVELIKYTYPFVGISDTEAMVHFNGHLYLFTKAVNPNNNATLDDSRTYLFRIPDTPMPGGAIHTAELLDSWQVIGEGEDPTHFRVTGADLSPDKKKLALLCYERVWIFSCFDGDDFFNGTVESFLTPYRQYEGIAFINNHEVAISKEGSNEDPNFNPRMFYLDLFPWMDSACIDCEKTVNGDFAQSNLAWSLFTAGGASGTLDLSSGRAEIDVQNIGSSQWHLNLRHKSLILENGKTYRITYTAHADDNRPISIIANKSDGSLGYYYKSQEISIQPATYSHEFTMNESTDYNSYLSFNVGNHLSHKVYFDNISLVETDCLDFHGVTGFPAAKPVNNGEPFFTLSPNPTNNATVLSIPAELADSKLTISLFGLGGQIYLSEEISNLSSYNLQTSFLNSGLYIVRLQAEDGQFFSQKLVLE